MGPTDNTTTTPVTPAAEPQAPVTPAPAANNGKMPAKFEDYEAEKKGKAQQKIDNKQPLSNADVLVLNGMTQMYDPALKAYKQVTLKDFYEFKKSMEE